MRAALREFSWPKLSHSLLLVMVGFYLAFHAVSGDRGLYAWFKETRKLEALQAELARVSAERDSYEQKISLLKPESLDLDMLDEQARSVLGFVEQDEIIILLPQH